MVEKIENVSRPTTALICPSWEFSWTQGGKETMLISQISAFICGYLAFVAAWNDRSHSIQMDINWKFYKNWNNSQCVLMSSLCWPIISGNLDFCGSSLRSKARQIVVLNWIFWSGHIPTRTRPRLSHFARCLMYWSRSRGFQLVDRVMTIAVDKTSNLLTLESHGIYFKTVIRSMTLR